MQPALRQHITNIRESLHAWRRHAWPRRFTGLSAEYQDAQQAILSLDALEAWMEDPQYTLMPEQEGTSHA